MITRKSFLFLLAVGIACLPFGARAAQFAFGGGEMAPMEVSEPMGTSRGFDRDAMPSRSALGGDARLSYSRATMADAASDDGAAARGETDAPVAAPVTTPRNTPPATPAAPNRARAGSRWQSLVPGAIK
ncbi:MAG TPA: hypothetical protein PKO41_05465 [Dokdonella sp.]|uniref:hypothetical protein n=1 Tax=Dokdonella sp. TaxID=2291710 RepID=UPI0025C6539D|nr:hypothetical protein [Dokdonella sp.]MBX3691043.1 hypothetical protein [Dokdonella sp.]MCW5567559.1 hypothetical protein [Dokdonella sp.]HNR91861.1 hypothetical protein [Dokdonella sp.]